jgi:hypothetical protein
VKLFRRNLWPFVGTVQTGERQHSQSVSGRPFPPILYLRFVGSLAVLWAHLRPGPSGIATAPDVRVSRQEQSSLQLGTTLYTFMYTNAVHISKPLKKDLL